jgi:hypothetical protein
MQHNSQLKLSLPIVKNLLMMMKTNDNLCGANGEKELSCRPIMRIIKVLIHPKDIKNCSNKTSLNFIRGIHSFHYIINHV